jgi:hypothetical protein
MQAISAGVMRIAMPDKRNIVRLKKRISVRFGVGEAARVAFTEDISLTGMFIKTANICQPNTRIMIEFELDGNPLKVEARVMWARKVPQNLFHLVKKGGMGVRFLSFEFGEEHLTAFFDIDTPTE